MVMADMQYEENKVTLTDIINQLSSFDSDDTIYARQPWTPDSEAIVATEPDDGGLPDKVAKINAEYFIEIFLADQFLKGWLLSHDKKLAVKDQCRRLVQYAENDARLLK
ncbi:hypothetical protein AAFN90_04055 [Erwiniaceae bacterium CAU 1747]